MIDTNLKILWVSDIHYSSGYTAAEKNDELKNYIAAFIDYCGTLKEIDYILLSGDVAQSGIAAEYDLFFEDILTPVLNLPNLKNAKLLVIPGNHDIDRNSGGVFFKEFFKSVLVAKRPDRMGFLTKNSKNFKKPFTAYSEKFAQFSDRFPATSSAGYKADFLHGYFFDHKKKIIFIMLNSSWYSFGEEFLKKYFDFTFLFKYIKSFFSKEYRDNLITGIVRMADDYGNQVVNYDVFEKSEFDTLKVLLKDYNDYIIIKTMHHPINWLGWDERVNYQGDKRNEFFNIKEKADLLLTGHEHVPKEHVPDYLNNKRLLHIPAGCFMNHSGDPKEFKVSGNFFSILDINIKKRTLSQNKIFYDGEAGIFKEEKGQLKQLSEWYNSKLTENREKAVSLKLEQNYQNSDFLAFLVEDEVVIKNGDFYNAKGDTLYYFLAKGIENFDGTALKAKLMAEKNIDIVYFIFVDLVEEEIEAQIFTQLKAEKIAKSEEIDPDWEKQYMNTYRLNENRLEVGDKIRKNVDFKFNRFRRDFFSNLQGNEEILIKKIKFVSKLTSFWQAESFFN